MTPIEKTEWENKLDEILQETKELLSKKNSDYGNSFAEVRKKIPHYFAGKVYDKTNRLINLDVNGNAQVDESIEDTIRDLIGYCVLELVERKTSEAAK